MVKKTRIILITFFLIMSIIVIIINVKTSDNLKIGKENELVNQSNLENEVQSDSSNKNYSAQQINQAIQVNIEQDALSEASFGKLDVPVYKKGEKDLKLPILIYHAFATPIPEGDVYNLFSTQERFEENVTTLLNAGYTFITLEDVYKYDKGYIGLPEKNITITMDDGWLGDYTEAFQVLKKYNVPATIFIVENLVGTEGYFSWDQAREMYNTGLVKIHVHGRNHVDATGYSKEKLIEDYNHSHQKIEEELGEEVQKIMAYPSGKSSENTIKWLKEAGFEVQVQTKYGTVNKSQTLNLTDLERIRGERATGKNILGQIM